MPGEKREQQEKKGFLRKLLFKDKEAPAEDEHHDEIDLDEIKQKLGLNDDPVPQPEAAPEAPPETPLTSFERPTEEPVQENVEIDNWTEHTTEHAATPSSWTDVEEETPETSSTWAGEEGEHHAMVDKHFATEMKKHEAVEEALQPEELQDWHVQDKEVPEDAYFFTKNGHKIRSLQELMDALEYVDDETFSHHMNEHQNDFANWIEGAVGNADLAEAFRQDHTREHAIATLQEHHDEKKQELNKHVQQHQKKIQQLEKLQTDLPKLQERVQTKAAQVADETHAAHRRMKQALDREVELRLADERHALDAERTKLHDLQANAEKELAKAQAEHDKLDARKERAQERETKLKEQREQLLAEKAEARELVKEAKSVQKDLEKITKHKEQIQQHLKEIESREKGLAEQEESLKQREAKMTKDITKLTEMQEQMQNVQADIEQREKTCKAQEAEASAIAKDAEQRTKKFKAQEDTSVQKIKAEKAKLETVRKKIEATLKKVIKNKEKAMYAKQLREELEKHIMDIKTAVVAEHQSMDKEAYATFIESKEGPVGQPASHAEDDVKNVKDLEIYKKVEQARKALHKKDLDGAKKLYNELRDEFNKAKKLKEAQKNILYISIRELYDDIHLAMLEQ